MAKNKQYHAAEQRKPEHMKVDSMRVEQGSRKELELKELKANTEDLRMDDHWKARIAPIKVEKYTDKTELEKSSPRIFLKLKSVIQNSIKKFICTSYLIVKLVS